MSNSTSLIDQIGAAQSGKEVVANALFDAASPAMIWGRHAQGSAGLTWAYFGGWFHGAQVNNGTVTLTASATNYVYADPVTGAVSVNTTGFPVNAIPLYTIVTGTSTVTSYTDQRDVAPNTTRLLSLSVAGGANVTLSASQSKAYILEFTGALTANINVVVPLTVRDWIVANKTSGAFTLTLISTSGTGITVGQGKRAVLYFDGTNMQRASADV